MIRAARCRIELLITSYYYGIPKLEISTLYEPNGSTPGSPKVTETTIKSKPRNPPTCCMFGMVVHKRLHQIACTKVRICRQLQHINTWNINNQPSTKRMSIPPHAYTLYDSEGTWFIRFHVDIMEIAAVAV